MSRDWTGIGKDGEEMKEDIVFVEEKLAGFYCVRAWAHALHLSLFLCHCFSSLKSFVDLAGSRHLIFIVGVARLLFSSERYRGEGSFQRQLDPSFGN